MIHDEKISIIMPAYNAGNYIRESIASVQVQTHKNWELIVIDDGSTDETKELLMELVVTDPRIVYKWQPNGKQGKARNSGLRMATGDYVAFLDADDVWLPNKLEIQLGILNHVNADLVFGYSLCIDKEVKTNRRTGYGNGLYTGEQAVRFLLDFGALVISTVLVRKSAVDTVGGFIEDGRVQYCEDWHFWLKLAIEGNGLYTDGSTVAYYRIHPTSAAQTEQDPEVKFYYALLDLHLRHPKNNQVAMEVRRRATNLIRHHRMLSDVLVKSILGFMADNGFRMLPRSFYDVAFALNERLFRKIFLSTSKHAG